jgi:hypothetical protein
MSCQIVNVYPITEIVSENHENKPKSYNHKIDQQKHPESVSNGVVSNIFDLEFAKKQHQKHSQKKNDVKWTRK